MEIIVLDGAAVTLTSSMCILCEAVRVAESNAVVEAFEVPQVKFAVSILVPAVFGVSIALLLS